MLLTMAGKLDDLLAKILNLPVQDRERWFAALQELGISAVSAARGPAESDERKSMTLVTVALPDDLAQLAEDAGLLAESPMEDLLRHALHEYSLRTYGVPPGQKRRLVRENGYLVVESLPGEKPITTEQVKKILDDVEW